MFTLVVRLHHTEPFQQDQLWRYAADFKTNTGKQLGVKLTRRAPGVGELEVYFDPAVAMEEKIIFSKYVHEHLLQHARDVERLRHYVCPKCDISLKGWRPPAQGKQATRAPPWVWRQRWSRSEGALVVPPAPSERGMFGHWNPGRRCACPGLIYPRPFRPIQAASRSSPPWRSRTRSAGSSMSAQSKPLNTPNTRKAEGVGSCFPSLFLFRVVCVVRGCSCLFRLEFTDDAHEATAAKLYPQLKSGDSYLRERKSDGAEIFTIKDERHARYWMAQAFPVLLVIRNSEGEVRWMEVRDWLKCASDNGRKLVKQIVFARERFDVMSVRRWRERVLGAGRKPEV